MSQLDRIEQLVKRVVENELNHLKIELGILRERVEWNTKITYGIFGLLVAGVIKLLFV